MSAIQVLEYLDASGRSPFRRWFDDLDSTAAAKIGTYLYRLDRGDSAGRQREETAASCDRRST